MKKIIQTVPPMRFRGFYDLWEARKLGDITYSSGKKNRENLSYESFSITNENGFVPQDEKFENGGSMREADKRMYIIVSPHSFAYNPARINIGSIGYQNKHKDVIVSSLYEVFKTTKDIDDHFLWYWFKSENFQKLIVRLQEGGVRLYFYYDKLCKGMILLPHLSEQNKISKFLDTLDSLINLYQRKLEQQKKLKKYFLQNMFPAKGEKVPKIRLKGFTSDWEQHNLGEITSKIGSGKTPSGGAKAYVNQGTILIRSQNVHDDMVDFSDVVFIDDETNKSMKNSIVVINDILLNITGASIGRSAVYKSIKSANVNQHVCIIRPISGYYSDFIQLYISSENGQKQIDLSQAGGGREGLNFQQISKFEFAFPSYDEQVKIGEYFRYTNDLIACNQHKIEKLRTLKKYMLQNMFI